MRDSTAGFTLLLEDLKTYLEHKIQLNPVLTDSRKNLMNTSINFHKTKCRKYQTLPTSL